MNKCRKLIVAGVLAVSLGVTPVSVNAYSSPVTYMQGAETADVALPVTVTANSASEVQTSFGKSNNAVSTWYKVTFEKAGFCVASYFVNDSKEAKSFWYNENGEELETVNGGLLHSEGTYYYKIYPYNYSKNEKQMITFKDDNHLENYATDKNNSTGTAYDLDEDILAYGAATEQGQWFQIDVPDGKKAVCDIRIPVESDLSKISEKPFNVQCLHESTNSMVSLGLVKTDTTFEEPLPAGTHYFCVKGSNEQLYSLEFSLVDDIKASSANSVIQGVKNNKTYHSAVTPIFDGKGKLNGKLFKSGTSIEKKGKYKLVVKDINGKSVKVKFKIK